MMAGYRALLTQPRVWWWMLATVGTRLAVCAVPLGMVFAAKEHTGSYAWGAVLAGAYAAGEAVGAPRMGARFQRRPLRRELSWVALAEAFALVGVVVSLSLGVPLVAVLLSAFAGGVASGTFGGLRTVVLSVVPGTRESALALDVIVNQVCQIAAPALAATAAVAWRADAPLLIVSGGLLIAVAAAGRLPESLPEARDGGNASMARVIRMIWPSMVVVTVVLMMQAVIEVTLPSILEQRDGSPALAGIALSGLAVASIAGSFLYGFRRWLGRRTCTRWCWLPCSPLSSPRPVWCGHLSSPWYWSRFRVSSRPPPAPRAV
jgi:hypothetical protein